MHNFYIINVIFNNVYYNKNVRQSFVLEKLPSSPNLLKTWQFHVQKSSLSILPLTMHKIKIILFYGVNKIRYNFNSQRKTKAGTDDERIIEYLANGFGANRIGMPALGARRIRSHPAARQVAVRLEVYVKRWMDQACLKVAGADAHLRRG